MEVDFKGIEENKKCGLIISLDAFDWNSGFIRRCISVRLWKSLYSFLVGDLKLGLNNGL